MRLTNKNVLELWQQPTYKGVVVNIYQLVNNYLLGKGVDISQDILNVFNFKTNRQFEEFLKTYIAFLTGLIKKQLSNTAQILYRGEYRDTLDELNVGNIYTNKNFYASTDDIRFAYSFSTNVWNKKRILFLIYLPKNSHFLKLETQMITYNGEIKEIQNEKEFIIPPGENFRIVEHSIVGSVTVIKMIRLPSDRKNFKDIQFNFLKYSVLQDQRYIMRMRKLASKSFVGEGLFEILGTTDDALSKISIKKVVKACKDVTNNTIDMKTFAETVKNEGINFEPWEVDFKDKFIKTICSVKELATYKFFTVPKLVVYLGFENFDKNMNNYEFVTTLKSSDRGSYNKVLKARLTPDEFLYEGLFNSFPSLTIQKQNKKELQYYKYLIKTNLHDVKIATCETIFSNHYWWLHTFILLLPSLRFEIINITSLKNKYGQTVEYYEVNLHT